LSRPLLSPKINDIFESDQNQTLVTLDVDMQHCDPEERAVAKAWEARAVSPGPACSWGAGQDRPRDHSFESSTTVLQKLEGQRARRQSPFAIELTPSRKTRSLSSLYLQFDEIGSP
jgi:hypothetical protein